MYQTVGPDDWLKDKLAAAKLAIAQRLYESTAATLQVNELYQEYIAMLADIGRRAGEDVVRSICKEAKVPFEQLFNTEGGANGRHVPAPAPRPQRNPNPAARGRGAQQTCALGVKLPAVATMLRTAPSAAPLVPTAPVAGTVRTAPMVAEPHSDAETEPADRTSPAPSSPTHKACTRAQKRRRDPLTRDPTLQLECVPIKKPRFGKFASTFTNVARSSSPLPPSSPVRTEWSSSVRMSSRSPPPLPPLPALSSVPRPPLRLFSGASGVCACYRGRASSRRVMSPLRAKAT
ncbi:hypothetical protein C8Q74DRAFT_118816 [Fomes fomentarius]|nr:hypothetical protein C8Q74DRAFT_118816 [Fomes fomentarius]